MFLIKNLRVYNIGKLSAAFSLSGPLCATFPYTLLGFFCRLNIVALDRDNGIFNSSNTDVVEKVNFLVAVSQHGGTSVAEGSP